jgi:hypothetical protein
MNMTAFWDVALCSLVGSRATFKRCVLPPSLIALMMEAMGTSETSVYFNEATQHYTPEGCHIHVSKA